MISICFLYVSTCMSHVKRKTAQRESRSDTCTARMLPGTAYQGRCATDASAIGNELPKQFKNRECRCGQSDLRQATRCGKIFAAADVAQLAEHITRNNEVMGSIPIIGSKAPHLRGVSFLSIFYLAILMNC